ncbi:flagellar hook-associated protein FlgK [Sporomusa aerivorans]|uniref:flagellar hook-associated protein FlgK n=1 Tax=Sporomusa aerivorans TaxID=204936 RepID=UPI00352AB217
MRSTFNLYNIAATGMYVNQAGLSVVSNNLSNIMTPGYSRQKLASVERVGSGAGGSPSYGCGTSVAKIGRARDSFLDQTYRQVNGRAVYYNLKYALIEDGQKLLNEYGVKDKSNESDKGLQQTVKNFFNSWDQLSKGVEGARSTIVGNATALVNAFNQINAQLQEMQQDAGNRVKDSVNMLNSCARELIALNREIVRAESGGVENGNLRDQRDALLDTMSSLANISAIEQPNGSVDVRIGGVALVQGDITHNLAVEETDGSFAIKWAELDLAADISSGSIKVNLEESDRRTGSDARYTFAPQGGSTLTDLRQGLNHMLTTIVSKVNSLLQSGKDLYGNTGEALFVKINSDEPLEAGNIKVNPVIANNVNKIAAGVSGAQSDYSVAIKINGLQNEAIFNFDGLPMTGTGFYQALISWGGTLGDTANSKYDTQAMLLMQVSNQRDTVSSVSQDEEMSKMIVYQNAYNASARVLSTIDSLVSDLINKLGR